MRGGRLVPRWSVALLACSLALPAAAAVSWPPGFDDETVAEELDRPTAFAFAPDGRIFVAEKGGRVRVIAADGRLLTTPFVTVSVNTQTDRGLVGLAIDPDFVTNRFVYLAYTTNIVPPSPKNSYSRIHRITRWTANGDVALPGSEAILVDGIPSDIDSHAGGALRFGPDGKLYAAIGDGAPYDFPAALALRALDPNELVGKVLRLNPDGSAPPDNPFYTTPAANRSKVFQVGLRNPFKAAFRPATGRLYVNDVGWSTWEEVNRGGPGASFGWPCWEGPDPQPVYRQYFGPECAVQAPQVPPLHGYLHNTDGGAATGAAFYVGGNYPSEYDDRFFFTDYARHFIKYLKVDASDALLSVHDFAQGDVFFRPVDLQLGPDGNMYYLNIATSFSYPTGSVNRLLWVGAGNHAPHPRASATPPWGYAPLTVTLSGAGTVDPDNDPLTYRWIFGDGGSADGETVVHAYAADGTYVATLEVDDGQVTTSAKVTVTVGSLPPAATILAPQAPATFVDGEVVAYSGTAADPDQGALPGDALRWTVIQHHNTHEHPYQDSVGPTGSFVAQAHGGTGELFFYELVLTATDASGLSSTARRTILPNQPPVARAGSDLAATCVAGGPRLALDGSASSDPDGQPLSFSWTQAAGPPVALDDPAAPRPSFQPPVVPGGATLTFALTVDDGHETAADDVAVSVPDLTDADGDGFPACSDCAPGDPATAPPPLATGLSVAADRATIRWTAVPGATSYELQRGTLAGPFAYSHACFASGLAGPSASDGTKPAAGTGLYYLARARSACGPGELGAGSSGVKRPNPSCP